jgi:hypothetical protein
MLMSRVSYRVEECHGFHHIPEYAEPDEIIYQITNDYGDVIEELDCDEDRAMLRCQMLTGMLFPEQIGLNLERVERFNDGEPDPVEILSCLTFDEDEQEVTEA